MTNQIIRRFKLEGITTEKNLVRNQATFRKTVTDMMRDEGFVPVLELDPIFTRHWLEGDKFEFSYTMQAVHIGKEKSWLTEGILAGKVIPFSQKSK